MIFANQRRENQVQEKCLERVRVIKEMLPQQKSTAVPNRFEKRKDKEQEGGDTRGELKGAAAPT